MNTGQATPIPPGEFAVGRDDDAYVRLDDTSVSRNHAKIYNGEDGLFVEDLGSSNGTLAQGVRVTGRTKVTFGDVIRFGAIPFRVDPEVRGEVITGPLAAPLPVVVSSTTNLSLTTTSLEGMPDTARKSESRQTKPVVAEASQVTGKDGGHQSTATSSRPPSVALPKRPPQVRLGGTPLPGAPNPQTLESASASKQEQPESKQEPVSSPPTAAVPKSQKAVPGTWAKTPKQKTGAPEPAQPALAKPETDAPASAKPVSPGVQAVPHAGAHWIWWLLVFLAGMGGGLILGLVFAHMFINMGGGKP